MKTFDEWSGSGKRLGQFLHEPCEIDEALAMYIGEIVAPAYVSPEFIQGGDAVRSIEGEDGDVFIYATVSMIGDKYFYLGELPEFKQ